MSQVLKLLNRTVSCHLVSDLVSSYPSKSRDPIQSHYMSSYPSMSRDSIEPHYVPGTDIINAFWHCRSSGDVVLAA